MTRNPQVILHLKLKFSVLNNGGVEMWGNNLVDRKVPFVGVRLFVSNDILPCCARDARTTTAVICSGARYMT